MREAREKVQREIEGRQALETNSTAFAIMHLGRMIQESRAFAGYEAIDDTYMTAIGIAIERLADSLLCGALDLEDEPSLQ